MPTAGNPPGTPQLRHLLGGSGAGSCVKWGGRRNDLRDRRSLRERDARSGLRGHASAAVAPIAATSRPAQRRREHRPADLLLRRSTRPGTPAGLQARPQQVQLQGGNWSVNRRDPRKDGLPSIVFMFRRDATRLARIEEAAAGQRPVQPRRSAPACRASSAPSARAGAAQPSSRRLENDGRRSRAGGVHDSGRHAFSSSRPGVDQADARSGPRCTASTHGRHRLEPAGVDTATSGREGSAAPRWA